jgi:hypothetical protein
MTTMRTTVSVGTPEGARKYPKSRS